MTANHPAAGDRQDLMRVKSQMLIWSTSSRSAVHNWVPSLDST